MSTQHQSQHDHPLTNPPASRAPVCGRCQSTGQIPSTQVRGLSFPCPTCSSVRQRYQPVDAGGCAPPVQAGAASRVEKAEPAPLFTMLDDEDDRRHDARLTRARRSSAWFLVGLAIGAAFVLLVVGSLRAFA